MVRGGNGEMWMRRAYIEKYSGVGCHIRVTMYLNEFVDRLLNHYFLERNSGMKEQTPGRRNIWTSMSSGAPFEKIGGGRSRRLVSLGRFSSWSRRE